MGKIIAKNIDWDIDKEDIVVELDNMTEEKASKLLGVSLETYESMTEDERYDIAEDLLRHNKISLNDFFKLPDEVEVPMRVVYYSLNEVFENEDEKRIQLQEDIVNYITDSLGFCINGCNIDGLDEILDNAYEINVQLEESLKDLNQKLGSLSFDFGYETRGLFTQYLDNLTSNPLVDENIFLKEFKYVLDNEYAEKLGKYGIKESLEKSVEDLFEDSDCFNESIDKRDIPNFDKFVEGMAEGLYENLNEIRDVLTNNLTGANLVSAKEMGTINKSKDNDTKTKGESR